MKRTPQPRGKRPLSPEKLQRREAIFALYRDMGPGRTYERLIDMVRPDYGLVSRRSLVNWSQQHSWRARVDEHDRSLAPTPEAGVEEFNPDFDMQGAFRKFTQASLRRVLASKPVVRTAQDAKTLVDTVEKAAKLVEMLKSTIGDPRAAEKRNEWYIQQATTLKNWVRLAHTAAGRAGLKVVKGELVPDDAATGMVRSPIGPEE